MSQKYKFRSRSERRAADYLIALNVDFKFEPHYIPYMWIESKKYLPDFILPSGIILEVKGRFTLDDRKKHLFLRQSNPDLDVRFVFDNPNKKLNKGAKTTYADWCNKNDFMFCKLSDGIPDSWLDERRNRKVSGRSRKSRRKQNNKS